MVPVLMLLIPVFVFAWLGFDLTMTEAFIVTLLLCLPLLFGGLLVLLNAPKGGRASMFGVTTILSIGAILFFVDLGMIKVLGYPQGIGLLGTVAEFGSRTSEIDDLKWEIKVAKGERNKLEAKLEEANGKAGEVDALHREINSLRGKLSSSEQSLRDARYALELNQARVRELTDELARQAATEPVVADAVSTEPQVDTEARLRFDVPTQKEVCTEPGTVEELRAKGCNWVRGTAVAVDGKRLAFTSADGQQRGHVCLATLLGNAATEKVGSGNNEFVLFLAGLRIGWERNTADLQDLPETRFGFPQVVQPDGSKYCGTVH